MLVALLRCVWSYPEWWIAMKDPNSKTFDYADSISPAFRHDDYALDTLGSRLQEVNKLYFSATRDDNIGLLEWNDQPSVRSPRVRRYTTPQPAHAKGFLIFDNLGGTLLTYSAPKFPTPGSIEDFFTPSAVKHAQHFMCITLTSTRVEEFANHVLLYLWPKITRTTKMNDADGTLVNKYPTLSNIVTNYRKMRWKINDGYGQLVWSFSNATSLTIVTKPGGKQESIYQYISQVLGKGPILAQTWLSGANEESTYPVRKICRLKNSNGEEWPTLSDHSKYFVGKDDDNHYVGVGDLNRQFNQWYRGGSLYFLRHPSLSMSMRSRIVAYEKTCEEAKYKCPPFYERNRNRDHEVCTLNKDCTCHVVECCIPTSHLQTPVCLSPRAACALSSRITRSLPPMGVCLLEDDGLVCVPGAEGVWSDWAIGPCSKPCGGTRKRTRTCIPPNDSAAICSGNSAETTSCNDGNCDCETGSGCGCPPSTDNRYSCHNGVRCAGSGCCHPHGGVERCPAHLPFMCSRKSCDNGVRCCVAASTGCYLDGGVLRDCPVCQDDDAGLQTEFGWEGYKCVDAQRAGHCAGTSYAGVMATHCPKSCDACSCQDDDAGLQAVPGWENTTCKYSSTRYCVSFPLIMKRYCAKSCGVCNCQDDDAGLQKEKNWSGNYCASSFSYCFGEYRVMMRKYCRKTCHVCVICQDDVAGLQAVPGWKDYTCADASYYYCTEYPDVMGKYCPVSCFICGDSYDVPEDGELRRKSNAGNACPESNCGVVSSLNAPCAVVAIEEISQTEWNKVFAVWVKDHCALQVYEHHAFQGAPKVFYPGAHEVELMSVRSAKCNCSWHPPLADGRPVDNGAIPRMGM